MQASIVTALMPITAAVPVTLIVLHEPESNSEPILAKTVPLQHITTRRVVHKAVSQTIPRSVTVRAKSLLKRAKSVPNHRTSLLKHVNSFKDKKSLLKPICGPLDESRPKRVTWPKRSTSLLKPAETNSEPSHNKSLHVSSKELISDKAIYASVRTPIHSVIKSKSNVSLLKPVIASQGKDCNKAKRETSKEEPQIVTSLNGEIIENLPRRVVRTVRPAKSLLKRDTLPIKHPNNSLRANLEDHAYTLNHSPVFHDRRQADVKRKRFAGDCTGEDSKLRSRAKQNIANVIKKLEKSKEKLHSRHRKMNSSIEQVTDLKNLLSDLKSRELVTEAGHSKLSKAVDRSITILKNNFTADPTA